MLRATMRKSKLKKARRFVGICAHAERLGVHRIHLYLVLSGKRESRSLLRRYGAMQKAS